MTVQLDFDTAYRHSCHLTHLCNRLNRHEPVPLPALVLVTFAMFGLFYLFERIRRR